MGTRIEIILSAVDNLSGTLAAAKGKVDRFGVDVDNTFKRSIVNGLKNMALGLAALVGFDALKRLTVDVIRFAESFDEVSKRLGTTYRETQELSYIALQCGTSVESLTKVMKFNAQNAEKVQNGDKKLTAEYKALGVAVVDTTGQLRGQTDVFFDTVSALQRIENPTARVAATYKIFGKGASEVLTIVNEGAGAIDEMRKKFVDLGLALSDETIQKMDKVTHDVGTMNTAFKVLSAEIMSGVAPALSTLALYLAEVAREVKNVVVDLDVLQLRAYEKEAAKVQATIAKMRQTPSPTHRGTIIENVDLTKQKERLAELQKLIADYKAVIDKEEGRGGAVVTTTGGFDPMAQAAAEAAAEKAAKVAEKAREKAERAHEKQLEIARRAHDEYEKGIQDQVDATTKRNQEMEKLQKEYEQGLVDATNAEVKQAQYTLDEKKRLAKEERDLIQDRINAVFAMAQSFSDATRMVLSAAWAAQDQRKNMHQLQTDIDNADTERERKIAEDRLRSAKQEAMVAKRRAMILAGLTMAEGAATSVKVWNEAFRSAPGEFYAKLVQAIATSAVVTAQTVAAVINIKSQSFATGTQFAPGGIARIHQDETVFLPRGSQVATARESRGMGAATLNVTINGGVTRETYPNVTKELRNLSRKMELANRRKYLRVTGNRLATS